MLEKVQQTIIIPETYANERLDQALAKLLPDYSRTQLQQWIVSGALLLNGKATKPKTKVKGGETITISATIQREEKWLAQDIPLNVVYEDEALLVIDKPAGLVVHPGSGNKDKTLLNALLHHAPELANLPRAGILHRIDKNTSGLLVVAKTNAALRNLSQQLKKHSLLREYQAIVYGHLISGGMVDAPIGRHHLQRKRMAVTDGGKKAITHYRVAEKYRSHTRLKLRLETGRTHQIRVHMFHIHHPIVGDINYGGRVRLSKGMSQELIIALREFKRQALHAYALGLTHPTTGEFMRWESDLPEDMQQLISKLRSDTERKK